MNVTTLKMDRGPALRAAEEYEQAVKSGKAYPGDEDLLAGYRALAAGKVVIDITTAFQEAGLDASGRPRLAIVRADAKRVHFRVRGSLGARFEADRCYLPDA